MGASDWEGGPLPPADPLSSEPGTVPAACVSRMRIAGSIGEAAGILHQVGQLIGLPTVAVIHDISSPVGPTDESGVKLADLFGWPRGYTEHWEKRKNSFHASVLLRCRSEHLPFHWSASEAPVSNAPGPVEPGPSLRGRRIIRELEGLGLRAAYIVPVHLPRGRVGAVGWWGDLPTPGLIRLSDTAAGALLLLAIYFFEVLRRTARDEMAGRSSVELSGREVECLTLAANGLTDGEIATRLQLSAHTIHFHLTNAATKLNARNRTHAVGLAAQLGIIGVVGAAV